MSRSDSALPRIGCPYEVQGLAALQNVNVAQWRVGSNAGLPFRDIGINKMAQTEEEKQKENLDLLSLNNQLCFALYSSSLEMTKLYRPLLEPLKLTYPQYLVMLVLWEQSGILVKELGAKLHLDSGTLTPLLKRMEKMGLVRRQRDAEDERGVIVTLTKQGENLKAKARRIPGVIACALGPSAKNFAALHKGVIEAREHIRAYREALSQG
jgi:DNA-binding MarR family transcriptional regulator